MDFDFGGTTPVAGRIVFVLCLDAAKMKERILVGDEGETRLRLEKNTRDVYYDKTRALECATAQTSFQPVLQYYLRRLAEWKLTFQQCKICGHYFLAKSRRYELCGKKCRTVQDTENKRQFDERAKEDGAELAYENTYTYWYNRMKKLRKNNAANPEGLAAAEESFAVFKAEGIRRKSEVKKNKSRQKKYIGWLLGQRTVIDALC